MCKNHELNVENRAKWNECYVSINEVMHRIYYKTTVDGMFHLYLNDKCVASKKNWVVKLQGFDYAVKIDGETIHCVFREKKLDVAMNGRYIKSQITYIPNKVLCRHYTAHMILALILGVVLFLELAKVTELKLMEFAIIFVLCIIGWEISSGYAMYYIKKAKAEQRLKEDI